MPERQGNNKRNEGKAYNISLPLVRVVHPDVARLQVHQNMLDKADQELMDRLRTKYQDGGPTDTLEQQDAGVNKSAAAAAVDSLAHVHVCHVCQGSGVQTELYEFRRLESTCKHCQGEGVLITGGKGSNSQDRNSNSNTPRNAPVEGARTVSGQTATATAEAEAKKRRHAERQAAKLQQKIEDVTQEKANMIAALTSESASGSSSTQRTLQENVVEQLQAYLGSLKAAHCAAMHELDSSQIASQA